MHRCLAELLDELRRVVPILGLLDTALEVPVERLLAPWAVDRVRDRGEGGHGAVLLRAAEDGAQVKRQRAVAAHGMAKYGLAREILPSRDSFSVYVM